MSAVGYSPDELGAIQEQEQEESEPLPRIFTYTPIPVDGATPTPLTKEAVEQIPLASIPILEEANSILSDDLTESASVSVSHPSVACPVPASQAKPVIQPRLTKSAALRMGIDIPKVTRPRPGSSKTTSPEDKPRRTLSPPASLANPSVLPRQNRASALRSGKDTASETRSVASRRQSTGTSQRSDASCFVGVPGHKRQSLSVSVSSTSKPTIAPRINKAAALRTGETKSDDSADINQHGVYVRPVSVARQSLGTSQRSVSTYDNVPGYKRRSLQIHVPSTKEPKVVPRSTKASSLRTGQPDLTRSTLDASGSVALAKDENKATSNAALKTSRRSSAIGIAALKSPSIQPRQNKSALLRSSVKSVAPLQTSKDVMSKSGSVRLPSRPKSSASMESAQAIKVKPDEVPSTAP